MQDFKMSGANMNCLIENLIKIQNIMDTSYGHLDQLLQRVEGSKEWEGETQKIFMAYMGLMKEYHKRFTSHAPEGYGNPLQEALDALNAHSERVDSFYREFSEYRKLEEIQ